MHAEKIISLPNLQLSIFNRKHSFLELFLKRLTMKNRQ
jgi:hypothetical protein